MFCLLNLLYQIKQLARQRRALIVKKIIMMDGIYITRATLTKTILFPDYVIDEKESSKSVHNTLQQITFRVHIYYRHLNTNLYPLLLNY